MEKSDPDETMMREALRVARRAARKGEVPVGAVLCRDDRVIARGGNATVAQRDPTAHAEVVALRRASRRLGSPRLVGCTLYVTLEPCLMCLGAMVQARIRRCVYGAQDPKVGAAAFLRRPSVRRGLNHHFPVEGGLLAEPAAALLRSFFRARRAGG